MAKIDPGRLTALREARGLSQAELAQRAKIDKQTVWRIENGKQGKTRRALTLERIARALNVERGVLTGELLVPDFAPPPRKSSSKISLSVQADNFLYLMADRYFVKPWQVMELAPLLFCWAAEMSLRERRERLKRLEEACKTARALEKEMPHLPDPNFTYSEAKIAAESRSIDANDIFGMCFGDDDFIDGSFYPPHDDTDNPFAMFLAKLVDDISDVAAFKGFSPTDYPIFELCREDARNLVGGDDELAERILTGVAVLSEMPKELQDIFGKTEMRAAWVRAQAEEFIQRHIRAAEARENIKETST